MVAAYWDIRVDAGIFSLFNIFLIVDLFNHAIACLVELAQEKLLVSLLIFLPHSRSATAENDVVLEIRLGGIRRSNQSCSKHGYT